MASNENRTLFVGNLSEKVTEDLLYELFLQVGPLNSVKIPTQNGRRRGFGFVEFKHEISVNYAVHLFEKTSLFGRWLKLQSRNPSRPVMNEEMLNSLPNPMCRLGPPINLQDRRLLLPPVTSITPSIIHHSNPYMSHRRTPSHLIPSPAKKRTHIEGADRKNIPDAINYRGLVGGKEDNNKRKNEKPHDDDLRSRLKKKKKKKKNKDSSAGKKPSSTTEEKKEDVARGGLNLNDYPPKSYFKNAVNQIRQHCSRNNRGSYDLSSKHKLPRHVRYNT